MSNLFVDHELITVTVELFGHFVWFYVSNIWIKIYHLRLLLFVIRSSDLLVSRKALEITWIWSDLFPLEIQLIKMWTLNQICIVCKSKCMHFWEGWLSMTQLRLLSFCLIFLVIDIFKHCRVYSMVWRACFLQICVPHSEKHLALCGTGNWWGHARPVPSPSMTVSNCSERGCCCTPVKQCHCMEHDRHSSNNNP